MSAAELFAGAGQKAGIEVWRIEALKPVKNKEAESGRLCTGDSYIVLHSIPVKSGGFDYNLHFWLGEESSQDEKGCAVREAQALRRLATRAARLAPRPSRLRKPRRHAQRVRAAVARPRAAIAATLRRLQRARAVGDRSVQHTAASRRVSGADGCAGGRRR
jgi:hypothetical protein